MMLKLPKILLETIYISGLKLLNFQIFYARELEAQKYVYVTFLIWVYLLWYYDGYGRVDWTV